MNMALTGRTVEHIDVMFAPEHRAHVVTILQQQCGSNLPGLDHFSAVELERVRFAALKLSDGDVDKLERAVRLAQTDWRDLLVAAGFADNLEAHRSWFPTRSK